MNLLSTLLLSLTSLASLPLAAATVTSPTYPNWPNVLPPGPPLAGRNITILTSGIERQFRLFGPGTSSTSFTCPGITRYPVILAFHGRGGSAYRMRDVSQLHNPSHCAIVVYPWGLYGDPNLSSSPDRERCWQPAPYCGSTGFQNPDDPASAAVTRDDVQFVRDILTWVRTYYGNGQFIDMSRVYAAGKSNGGGFVDHLACTMANQIAAIAPVSGPFYGTYDASPGAPFPKCLHPSSCVPSRLVPIISIHGDKDEKVRYVGSPSWEGGCIQSLPNWVTWWKTFGGCSTSSVEIEDTTKTEAILDQKTFITSHTGCTRDSRAEIRHYRVQNGLHDWPSKAQNLDNTDDESDPRQYDSSETSDWTPGTFNGTAEIVQFFYRFTL